MASVTTGTHFPNDSSVSTQGYGAPSTMSDTNWSWCDKTLKHHDILYNPWDNNVAIIVWVLVATIGAVTSVAGYTVVIIVVLTDKPLRSITSRLITSLAVATITGCVFSQVQLVTSVLAEPTWNVTSVWCDMYWALALAFGFTQILHVSGLAVERYLAICHPFKYERIGRRFLKVAIFLLWTTPLFFSFLPVLMHWTRIGIEDFYECFSRKKTHVCVQFTNRSFSVIAFILMFFFPTIVMCISYGLIYKTSRNQRNRMSAVSLGSFSTTENKDSLDKYDQSEDSGLVFDNRPGSGAEIAENQIGSENHGAQRNDTSVKCLSSGKVDEKTPVIRTTPIKSFKRLAIKIVPRCIRSDEFKAARTLCIIFIVYILTWAPFWVVNIMVPFAGHNDISGSVKGVVILIAFFGVSFNPFIYYFSNAAVRKGIKELLRKCFYRYRWYDC